MPAFSGPDFPSKTLPRLIGFFTFLFFLLTLNHWVSLLNLGMVSRVSGWLWRPQLDQPLTTVVFFPFRFLPKSWIPLALNLCTAACASLILTFLARSVAILPYDLTRSKPFAKDGPPVILTIPMAWIPPLLASVLCALQLSFWEHATSASGEMIDLLVFAYVVKCLLEYRLDPQQFWLSRAAVVYGAGMADNWAMIGFFPVFIIALVGLKGYNPFREAPFLRRMAAWGLAGLSLFLLLPLLHALSPYSHVDFWTALKAHLKSQVEFLGYMRRSRFRILAVASLLPVIVLSIRWRSHTIQFGDDTRLGNFLTKATVNLVHALFFLASLWIALDPTFSPRNLDLGTPMLTYYYLSAMVFGYCAGYFLLFGSKPAEAGPDGLLSPYWRNVRDYVNRITESLVPVVGIGLVIMVPLLLFTRNFGQIHETNAPYLSRLTQNIYADLPAGKSIVLSDDPVELLLMQAEAARNPGEKQPLFIDAPSLTSDPYHFFVARKFKSRWPSAATTNAPGTPGNVLRLIANFATNQPVLYLHPGFGPLFELYQSRPQGSIYALVPRRHEEVVLSTNIPSGMRVKQDESVEHIRENLISENESIWNKRWTERLERLSNKVRHQTFQDRGKDRMIFATLYIAREANRTISFVGASYSKRLNYWGVHSQRIAPGIDAKRWFERAIALNPDNLTALINLNYAQRSPSEKSQFTAAAIQNKFPDLFGRFHNWPEILKANGPVDEPNFLFRTGRILLERGSNLQAIESFQRCLELAPDWPIANVWLAQACFQSRNFDSVLKITEALDAAHSLQDGPSLGQILHLRVAALRNLGHTNEAAAYLETSVTNHADRSEVLSVAAELYAGSKQFDLELQLLEQLLKREPTRPDFLARKGLAQVQLFQYPAAIATLTDVLKIVPKNEYARLYRAVAYLGLDKFDEARADYEELLTSSNPRNALFGLGTVAWRQSQTNLAIKYYKKYLSSRMPSAPNTHQDLLAQSRLSQLQSK